ncbi:alpha/beta hydrolase [Hufsiella ginkgonis]|uniref:Alpha/beta fold hydrolase n=1 Tax=Hufsiella ginkgonis TaxID=2695274 RepID=A0A7K1Y3U2_9SPHI|nr:alpha/beta fold hydrolase [Hufsiella ginkgonis]MXV17921.1 alpha/beta fold hydrolase [Hufsiella ginkgonis]
MKNLLFALLLIGTVQPVPAQTRTAKPVYVIVHGAWGGSWAFREVDSILTARGCNVYRPSLTGQGERVHLASPEVGLGTHIKDVVNEILFENLHNVVLVGHSYGGMVITGVADSIPERVKQLIYVDALLPRDGESLKTALGRTAEQLAKNAKDGFIIPAWVKPGQPLPKDVPQSLKTFTEPVHLKNKAADKIPATYILTVAKGTDPAADDFASQAERARQRKWPVLQLEADHNPQWSAVNAFSEMLFKIGNP